MRESQVVSLVMMTCKEYESYTEKYNIKHVLYIIAHIMLPEVAM